jgi:uncharacterized protein YukE
MENLNVDYDGANINVITPIQSEIEKMEDAAATITKLMGDLASYWSGKSFNKAVQTYQDDYKGFIEVKVPETMEDFKNYIQGCLDKLKETDESLAGM